MSGITFGEMNFSEPSYHQQCTYEQLTKTATTSENLYPGANITQFQAISMITSLHPGISKAAFDRLLYLLHTHILPKGNILPQSYREAKSVLRDLLTPTKEYHCCINDCVVFRDSDPALYLWPKFSYPFHNHYSFQTQTNIEVRQFLYPVL